MKFGAVLGDKHNTIVKKKSTNCLSMIHRDKEEEKEFSNTGIITLSIIYLLKLRACELPID